MHKETRKLKKKYRIEHMIREKISEKDKKDRHQRRRKDGSPSLKEWGKNLTGKEKKEYESWLDRKRHGGTPKRRGKKK